MDPSGLLVFAAAYAMATASPGPGVAAVVARVLARGTAGTPAFIAGFVAGDLVWFTLAATGLAVLAQAFAGLFLAVRYAGAAYLLWLAWRLWTAPAGPVEPAAAPPAEGGMRLFLAGLAITLGNPKVIVFFIALLPTVVDLAALTPSAPPRSRASASPSSPRCSAPTPRRRRGRDGSSPHPARSGW